MGIEDFVSSIPVFFTIDLWLLNERLFFLYVLWRPKYQRPGTRKVQSARSLFTSCRKATFLSQTSLATQAYRMFFGCCGTPSVIHALRV